jgi:ribose transport system ATP-binding protein
MSETARLDAVAIRKEYPGTLALNDVTVSFEGGRVHALLGKNGAGKSTLVKIIAGTETATRGKLLLNGSEVHIRTATDAFDQGIATVYQELSLVPDLTIAENILLGRLPRHGIIIDWPKAYKLAQAILDDMGVKLNVRSKVSELGVAQQQVVEIAKAMSFKPSVIMLDEPTSALAQHETDLLFELIRKLAQRGVVIIYITHRLHELKLIADTLTILRDGNLIGRIEMQGSTPEQIVHMMFGEIARKERPAYQPTTDVPVLEVHHLSKEGKFHDVNFDLGQGEILGIAGMLGSGRTELLKAIFGAEPADSGNIMLGGKNIRPHSPHQMKDYGVALTPENRKSEGLVQMLSTRANMCMASLDQIAVKGFIRASHERQAVARYVESLAIKVPDVENAVSSLSGGNQQKVVVGKWLSTQPKVMLFDEPTRGIDVHAKQQIFDIIWALSAEGISSIIVSSELEELLDVCHRIVIMRNGRITSEVDPEGVSADELIVRCMEDE